MLFVKGPVSRHAKGLLLVAGLAILGGCSNGAEPTSTAPALPLGLVDTPNPQGLPFGAQVGQVAPNWRLATPEGGVITLADTRGKFVLVNFWATWCAPCRQEMPELQAAFLRYSDSLAVITVDLDESAAQVTRYKQDLKLTVPTPLDKGQKVWEAYEPFGVPSSFILDPEGVVRTVKFGPFINQDDIEASLKKAGFPG